MQNGSSLRSLHLSKASPVSCLNAWCYVPVAILNRAQIVVVIAGDVWARYSNVYTLSFYYSHWSSPVSWRGNGIVLGIFFSHSLSQIWSIGGSLSLFYDSNLDTNGNGKKRTKTIF